ncbi:23S rRNA pseudouridine(1911/1915/1917) synthase RluD [Thiohalomonas denitrificans]|uniref:23S rRNA pseudouridine(1911/1915/1917) synthase RluD n=1 Tax=Thiohalomonas denitrificans TaxID=415747 RepID=UPI0026EF38D2|nr:23S rRNA pseudouridine(1911/1915/1917) synthase RluD [Thiohalomonas denitrificans]
MKQDEPPRRVAVPAESAGRRLDQVLADLFPEYSRSRLQQWVKEGRVRVDGKSMRPKDKLQGIEQIELEPVVEPEQRWEAEAIPLDIRYEDEQLIVLNKPAGLVVHPAAGNRAGTMLNALLHHAPELASVPRAGIVHRLDKETSGLLVVARTLQAQTALVAQLQARSMTREYRAVVSGVMTGGGTVEAPIGRHAVDRKRMAVTPSGKPAVTHYRVVERFRGHTHIKVRLETGRTHQIRVHMAHIRYPLVGDPVYGGRLKLPKGCSEALRQVLRGFHRQALHAGRLGLEHPGSGLAMEWEAELPEDMCRLLEALRNDAEQEGSA